LGEVVTRPPPRPFFFTQEKTIYEAEKLKKNYTILDEKLKDVQNYTF
jgi:hypothetical protein